MTSRRVERIGVVIPAHNEETHLPACLAAIEASISAVDVPVTVVVTLDRCHDASADVVAAFPWASSIAVTAGNVGLARRAGTSELLRQMTSTAADRIWLTTTDADSEVPAHWLATHRDLREDGWDAVLGTVTITDWSAHHPDVSRRWLAGYHQEDDHPHVHGANLGFSAAAYLEVGGWPPLAAHEDVALVRALTHHRVISTGQAPVVTSARSTGRAVGGFADAIRTLAC